MIRVLTTDTTSPHYEAERELRNRVLLRPIGLPDHAWEMRDQESHHILALDGDELVGCVLLWPDPENPERAQLLQMATDTKMQGRGVGRKMFQKLRELALALGVKTIFCHARTDVQAFYQKLDFQALGEIFVEVGIEHQQMEWKAEETL